MSTFAGIIEKYGDDAQLFGEINGTARCLIEPVLSKSTDRTWSDENDLGTRDASRFYGFFPPEAAMSGCKYISCGEREYDVLRVEIFRAPGGASHWEALLRIRPEAEDD